METWLGWGGLAFGLLAVTWSYWRESYKITRLETRVEELKSCLRVIGMLIRHWQGEDADFRGKGGTSPHEMLTTVRDLAEGAEFTPSTHPMLFHECGCPKFVKDPLFHPETSIGWCPPSVLEEYCGSPPLGHVGEPGQPMQAPIGSPRSFSTVSAGNVKIRPCYCEEDD